MTVHRPPSVRTTGKPMFNLTLSSQFGSTGKMILHTYCTLMLWSIDSCQNRVYADQYHLTVSRAQVSTHRGRVFFDAIRWQVTSFQIIASTSYFLKFIWNMLRLCATQLKSWFQSDLRRANSSSYYRHSLPQPPGRFSLSLEVKREKALASTGHMTTKHPEFVGVLN